MILGSCTQRQHVHVKLQNGFVRECFVGVTMEEGRVSVIQEAGTSCGRDKVFVLYLFLVFVWHKLWSG